MYQQENNKYPNTKKKYLSDIITADEILFMTKGKQKWLITTPTGSGKTFFVEEYIAKRIKNFEGSIALISNRILLKEQILSREHKLNFRCITYQSITSIDQLKDYDIIILDEAHYFFNDSMFNTNTKKHFEIINKAYASMIYLTATPNFLIKYFNTIKYKYKTLINEFIQINSSIMKIHFINQNVDEIINIVNNRPKEKFLIFNNNNQENLLIKEQIKDSEMIMSKWNEKYQIYNSIEQLKNIVELYKFKCRVLIATSVLDNGVSIKDKELKNIILTLLDPVQLNQSLGRIRCEDDQKLELWLHDLPSKNKINKRIDELKKIMESLDNFDKKGITSVTEKFKEYFVQDKDTEKWYYNEFIRIQIEENIKQYEMFRTFTKEQYYKWVYNILNLEENFDVETKEIIFVEKIKEFVEKKLFSDEQEKLKEICEKYITETKQKSKYKTLGINKLNELFLQFNFNIISKQENIKNENRNKMYWIINKI